jgi:hypothetical protein
LLQLLGQARDNFRMFGRQVFGFGDIPAEAVELGIGQTL